VLLMRNIFDQYEQPENRLTHALLCSLDADRRLLAGFVQWVTGAARIKGALQVLEQSLPGDELSALGEGDRRGIPDGCICDGSGWAILIESKLVNRWDPDQLRRHRASAERRDLRDVIILCLTVGRSRQAVPLGCVARTWSDVYAWLQSHAPSSDWAHRCQQYFEVAEAQMIERNGLAGGAITMFAGIPFNDEQPYSYVQAKRVLGLLRACLLEDEALKRDLAVDSANPGRGAITGTKSRYVWDFIGLLGAQGAGAFTAYPHLTLSVLDDRLEAMLTLPNGVSASLRRAVLGSSYEAFEQRVSEVTRAMAAIEKVATGVRPLIHIVQRHYPSQRSTAILDASLRFDPRTAVVGVGGQEKGIKPQPEWLRLAYEVLDKRQSNMQFQIGAEFLYASCDTVRTAQIAQAVAAAWRACRPFLALPAAASGRAR
jgi:hypothetical protein